MIPNVNVRTFAEAWAAAWNARDVETVLSHFHAEASFSSPIAKRLGHGEGGVVVGKYALRSYWQAALEMNPDLHFTVENVFAGVDVMVIAYTTQSGAQRVEVLTFRDDRVIAGYGTLAEPGFDQ